MEDNSLERENIATAINKFKTTSPVATQAAIQNSYENVLTKETDPDLMMTYEIVKLPSNGLIYPLSEVNVEYMTSKDEDLLTTPSLIDSGNVLDMLLKRKIKTPGINIDNLLPGDRNAILLYLRTSSYGSDYTVQVTDPRTGIPFTTTINLLKLGYHKMAELPDEHGYFYVDIPMRKKRITFKLLTSGEEMIIKNKAEAIQLAYNDDINPLGTMKLKASIVAINERTDRAYIDKFIDVMPALDSYTIRKKIVDVSPDVEMIYEFMAKDGYTFKANLTIGLDFFFPRI